MHAPHSTSVVASMQGSLMTSEDGLSTTPMAHHVMASQGSMLLQVPQVVCSLHYQAC